METTINKSRFTHKVNRRFTKEEDEMLTKLVNLYGAGNWLFIASCMKTRNSRQCKDRWCQYLSPEANQSAWTQEEEERLKKLYKELNGKWLEIGKYFEGRALSQIRNKWKTLERRRVIGRQRRSKYSVKETPILMNFNEFNEINDDQQQNQEEPKEESVFDAFEDDVNQELYAFDNDFTIF